MKSKFFVLTLRLLTSTFDLITDWLLYYEVSGIEQGLVFGPFSDALLGFLILFCCIGTVAYITELVLNLLDKCAAKEDLLPSDLIDNINLVSLWIEDVPLILMSVYIAGCRDTAVTVILLLKGLSTLLKVFVNVIAFIVKHINNKTQTEITRFDGNRKTNWLKIPAAIGLFIMLVCSLLVFTLGKYITDSNNVIQLSSPLALSFGHYNAVNYVDGFGVYMNFDPGQTNVVTMNTDEYIKLADFTNITTSQSGTFIVSVTYNSNPNSRLRIQSTSSSDVTSPESSTCYSTQTSPLPVLTTCSTDIPLTSTTTSIVFKFVYESPSSRKPLGDIFYNYRLTSFSGTGSCACTMATPSFSLIYFKATYNVKYLNPLVTFSMGSGEYYKTGNNLESVFEAWRTGHFGCGPTGRTSPHQDTSISVPCLTWAPGVTTSMDQTTTTPTMTASATSSTTATQLSSITTSSTAIATTMTSSRPNGGGSPTGSGLGPVSLDKDGNMV